MQTSWKWKEKQGSSVLQMKWWQTTRPSSLCLIIGKRSWDGYKGSSVWSGGVSNIWFQIHFQRNRFFSDPYLTLLTSSLCFPGSVYDKGVIWRKRVITAIHVGPFLVSLWNSVFCRCPCLVGECTLCTWFCTHTQSKFVRAISVELRKCLHLSPCQLHFIIKYSQTDFFF